MSNASKAYEIVYSSDITIEEAGELAALCIFYDRIVLPGVTDAQVDSITVRLDDTMQSLEALRTLSKGHFARGPVDWSDAASWDAAHHALFQENVLARLGPPPNPHGAMDEDVFFELSAEDQFLALTQMKRWEVEEDADGEAFLTIRPDILAHLQRADLELPQMHTCGRQPASREVMKYLQARSAFSYTLPKLQRLRVDEILELRRRVKDTREGFSMHLQKLSQRLEQQARHGASIADISRDAQSLMETELVPDYVEFRRQLRGEPLSNGKRILDVAGKVLKIDASPWTPKFWGELLEALGVSLGDSKERREKASNKAHAFRFLNILES